MSRVLPSSGIHILNIKHLGKTDSVYIGIAWKDFKDINKDWYLGSEKNPESIGYACYTGKKWYLGNYTKYGQGLKTGDTL